MPFVGQCRISLPAPPRSEYEFPPEFVRSGRYLVRGAGSQLVGVDLHEARVAWETKGGPGWTGTDGTMWGGADGTCVAVLTGGGGGSRVRGVAASSGDEIWKTRCTPTDTTELWSRCLRGGPFGVEYGACLLQRQDMLALAVMSNPMRTERTETGEFTTHLSSSQPLIEVTRLDPADGKQLWRTEPARAACGGVSVPTRWDGLVFRDGALASLDWARGEWAPLTEADGPPNALARSGTIIGAMWLRRGGMRLAAIDSRDGCVRHSQHQERGIRSVAAYPVGAGDFLLAINSRTVALMNAAAEVRWRARIGANVYRVFGSPGSPVFVDTAGAGAALYAFDRSTGAVLIHERSALGGGGDLTRVEGTDLLAVSLSSRKSHAAGGLVVVGVDGTGLRRLDVPSGIVGSYRGSVITRAEMDRDGWLLSNDVVVTAVAEG